MPQAINDFPGKVIVARRCDDNARVYLSPGGSWNEDRSFARIVTSLDDQQRLLRIAREDAANRLVRYPHLSDGNGEAEL